MSSPGLTHITAKVAEMRQKLPRHRVFALRHSGPWSGPDAATIAGDTFRIRFCGSPLAIREALVEAEDPPAPLIVLTPLTEIELEHDVRARLAKRRVHPLEPWGLLREVLQAQRIDPRLTREPWLAEALLKARPASGWPALPGGVLDADTAWGLLLSQHLGLETPRPDLTTLLRWAMTEGARLAQVPDPLRTSLRDWLATAAGGGASALLQAATNDPADVVPLGLACGVVFHPEGQGRPALERAAVRLEGFTGGIRLDASGGRRWADAAVSVLEDRLRNEGFAAARPWLERADALLAQVEASAEATLSQWTLAGFEARVAALGRAIEAAQGKETGPVEDALSELQTHGLARFAASRVEVAEMALRLVRWLGTPEAAPASPSEAASAYATQGSFVDLARTRLAAGDEQPAMGQALRKLLSQATERRERESEAFAARVASWVEAGSSPAGLLPIEQVLDRVVAPLAREVPVLLLVLDGMSLAVWHELVDDILGQGWWPIQPSGSPLPFGMAAFPTVTEVSRASLLAGRLANGDSVFEKKAFGEHAGLLATGARKLPPLLLHKADLQDAAGLPAPLQAEIAGDERRVVAVVINSVDDHLVKGDQVRPRWSMDYVAPLRGLLHAAWEGGRVVIATADHGHVPEAGTEMRQAAVEGERWRAATDKPGAGEIVLHGPRVVLGGGRIIAPWSERIRYGAKRNGYHGGVAPQEVVVPLAVLSPALDVEGWEESTAPRPDWWTAPARDGSAPAAIPAPPRPAPRRARSSKKGQSHEQLALPETQAPMAAAVASKDLFERLRASAVFKAQAAAAGRTALSDDQWRNLLNALRERGGRATRAALAQRLSLPPMRLTGLLSAARRVLNVDGFAVLAVDEASDSVELNLALLASQFEIEGP
jgi:hypothetical protein